MSTWAEVHLLRRGEVVSSMVWKSMHRTAREIPAALIPLLPPLTTEWDTMVVYKSGRCRYRRERGRAE